MHNDRCHQRSTRALFRHEEICQSRGIRPAAGKRSRNERSFGLRRRIGSLRCGTNSALAQSRSLRWTNRAMETEMVKRRITLFALFGCFAAVGCGGSNQPANDPSSAAGPGGTGASNGAGMTGPTGNNSGATTTPGSDATGTGTPVGGANGSPGAGTTGGGPGPGPSGSGTGSGSGSGSGTAGH